MAKLKAVADGDPPILEKTLLNLNRSIPSYFWIKGYNLTLDLYFTAKGVADRKTYTWEFKAVDLIPLPDGSNAAFLVAPKPTTSPFPLKNKAKRLPVTASAILDISITVTNNGTPGDTLPGVAVILD